jgi:hypothetical protein
MRNTETLTLQEYTFTELEAKFNELNALAFRAISFNDLATLNSATKSLEAVRHELARRVEVYVSSAG